MSEEHNGATPNERLLAAARDDNEDLLLEIFDEGGFDINCTDGLGNTPLHNAVINGSTDVLEHILSQEDCDVDPVNKLGGSTPLHLAVAIEHRDLRLHIFESLLEAGADTTIRDKLGETVMDILPQDDPRLRDAIRRLQAKASVSRDDIAHDDDEDDEGSMSGSEE